MILLVKLDNDDLKRISLFESITGAMVKDCVVLPDGNLVFLVKEGDLGRAIGKKGMAINKARGAFKKRVDVFESSESLEGFVKNLFPGIELKTFDVKDRSGRKQVVITVDSKDRGAVIGRNGDRIKLARTLLDRHYEADLKLL